MNKIDTAWVVLQSLSPREQEAAAEAILDYAEAIAGPALSDAQVREIEQPLADVDEPTITPAELRLRMDNLL